MKLTEKQKRFVDKYYEENKNNKNAIATIEEVAKAIVVLYLESKHDRDKEYSAWLIARIKVKLIGIEKLLDMEELYRYAWNKQKKIDKQAKVAQKRRHQKRGDFALTDEQWEQCMEYFDYSCAYCGEDRKLTYDHFIPFSNGGSFKVDNIIPACKSCNSSKNNKNFDDWYISQSFFNIERKQSILSYIKLVSING